MHTIPQPQAARAAAGIPRTVPLMDVRHYSRNSLELFQDVLARIYKAGDVDGPIRVGPGDTVGGALNIAEQDVAVALAQADSLLLGLVRTLMLDAGASSSDADAVVSMLVGSLTSTLDTTFRAKAHQLERGLTVLTSTDLITEAQVDQIVGAFRSFGQVIADALAFEFPALDLRADIDDDRYAKLEGGYTAVISSDPREVLRVSSTESEDRLEITLALESFEIADSADFRFFKEKRGGDKEKYEWLLEEVGAVRFEGIEVVVWLDDELNRAAANDYPWAPRHDVRRADWARTSAHVRVDDVSVDLHGWVLDTVAALWSIFSRNTLEDVVADAVRDAVNDGGAIDELQSTAREYITPIALKLMPVAHALSRVAYGAPFEVDGVTAFERFEVLDTVYSPHGVGIMNPRPDPIEITLDEDEEPHVDVLDEWKWPSDGAGGPRPRLDLSLPADRERALAIIAASPLPAAAKAVATLDVEGLDAVQIAALDPDAALPVSPQALALVRAAGPGMPRTSGEARMQLAYARDVVAISDETSFEPVPGLTIPGLDPGIWRLEHADESPLARSRGSATDPGWVGLSTNCVVATRLYRRLRHQGLIAGSGRAGADQYEIRGCDDIAADFTGGIPSRAPAVALARLVVALGTKAYVVDARLRTKPVIYSRGCLADDAVTAVFDSRSCLEEMTGGTFPQDTWLRQIAYRDFVFLAPDIRSETLDVNVLGPVKDTSGRVASSDVERRLQAALADWFPTLPEVPILYNSFRPLGGETRDYAAQDGWLSVYRRYAFRAFV